MKRPPADSGFTLIELLVVIAIISVLAAIIFPVFAQARDKAREADCQSNQKQIGLAILQYLQDNDDAFPLGEVYDPNGYDGNPPGWCYYEPYNFPSTGAVSGQTWANSIQPYLKNTSVFLCKSSVSSGSLNNATSYTYNGDLQSSTESAVIAPASVILVWPGYGQHAVSGEVNELPALYCPDPTQPCVYVEQNDTGCASDANGNLLNGAEDYLVVDGSHTPFNKWVHGHGDVFLYADGHVKWQPLMGDPNHDPWTYGNTDGNFNPPPNGPGSTVLDNNSDGCHSYLFEPDFQP